MAFDIIEPEDVYPLVFYFYTIVKINSNIGGINMANNLTMSIRIGQPFHVLFVRLKNGESRMLTKNDIPFLNSINCPISAYNKRIPFGERFNPLLIKELHLTRVIVDSNGTRYILEGVNCGQQTVLAHDIGNIAFQTIEDAKSAIEKYTISKQNITAADIYHYFTGKNRSRIDQLSGTLTVSDKIKDVCVTHPGSLSDGYHTFDELYDHRAALFVALTYLLPEKSWKSRYHHDGTAYPDMFIVGINLPTGQITYHYNIQLWWHCFNCKELDRAPEWDGHTSDDVIKRLCELPNYGYDWVNS